MKIHIMQQHPENEIRLKMITKIEKSEEINTKSKANKVQTKSNTLFFQKRLKHENQFHR